MEYKSFNIEPIFPRLLAFNIPTSLIVPNPRVDDVRASKKKSRGLVSNEICISIKMSSQTSGKKREAVGRLVASADADSFRYSQLLNCMQKHDGHP